MRTYDEGVLGRADYLMTYGWNWKFTNATPVAPKPVKRKLFADESFQNLRPSITVYRE